MLIIKSVFKNSDKKNPYPYLTLMTKIKKKYFLMANFQAHNNLDDKKIYFLINKLQI